MSALGGTSNVLTFKHFFKPNPYLLVLNSELTRPEFYRVGTGILLLVLESYGFVLGVVCLFCLSLSTDFHDNLSATDKLSVEKTTF